MFQRRGPRSVVTDSRSVSAVTMVSRSSPSAASTRQAVPGCVVTWISPQFTTRSMSAVEPNEPSRVSAVPTGASALVHGNATSGIATAAPASTMPGSAAATIPAGRAAGERRTTSATPIAMTATGQ